MKAAVTGSNGFLGARLVKKLNERGYQTLGIDLPGCDITDFSAVRKVLSDFQPDVVIHCAAIGDIWRCEENHDLAIKVNIFGTRNIASACADLDCAMVFISSDQVYNYYAMERIDEYTPVKPTNFYGVTKVEGENIVKNLVSRHYICRIAWQYGFSEENLPNSRDGLFEQILKAIKDNAKIKFTENSYQNINYVYDTVDALVAMAERSIPYGIYNITSQNEMSDKEMRLYILKSLGGDENLLEKDGGNKPFDLRAESLNLKLAGYKMPTFTEGLARALSEYKNSL